MNEVKQFCRLCAKFKSSTEMRGELNDSSFKHKLIVCCQWNNLVQLANEYFPKNVCITCIQKLEYCWEFSESVSMAQRNLLNIINNIRALDSDDTNDSNSNDAIEKVHIKIEFNDNELDEPFIFDNTDQMDGDSVSKIDVIDGKNNEDVETHKKNSTTIEEMLTSKRKGLIDDEMKNKHWNTVNILINEQKSDDECKEMCTNNLAMKVKPSTSQTVQKIRKRPDPYTKPHLKRPVDDFLKNIRNEDRMDDGTVDQQRILELELKSWLVMQYQCYLCGCCLGDNYKLKMHFSQEHPKKQLKYLCCFCSKLNIKHSVKHRHTIHEHIRNYHLSYLKYCCWKCNKFFWDLNKMGQHVTEHKRLPNLTGALCDTCGRIFEHESALRSHAQSHLPAILKPTFECYLCRKHFGSKLALGYHMRNHIDSPKFKCETCGREFYRKDLLKRHSYSHLDLYPHLCSHCGKKFKQKIHLVNHIRIHSNERPYHCNYCPYTCTDCANVLKHIRQKHRLTGSVMKQHYTRKVKLP